MPKPWACALCHLAPPTWRAAARSAICATCASRGWRRAGWRGALWGSIALPLALWPPTGARTAHAWLSMHGSGTGATRAIAGIPPQDV